MGEMPLLHNGFFTDRRNFAGTTLEAWKQELIHGTQAIGFNNVVDDVFGNAPYMALSLSPSTLGSYNVFDPPSSFGQLSGAWVCVI